MARSVDELREVIRWNRRQPPRRRRGALSPFERQAGRMGLQVVAPSEEAVELTGRLFGAQVSARCADRHRSEPTWTVEICHPRLPKSLTIQVDSGLFGLLQRLRRGDLETGDDAFDERVLVRGHEAVTLAVLSAPIRARLTDWLDRGVRFERGCLRWEGEVRSERQLLEQVRDMAHLCRAMRPGRGDLSAQLIRNAARERQVGPMLAMLSAVDGEALGDRRVPLMLRQGADSAVEADREQCLAILERLLEHHPDALLGLAPECLVLLLDSRAHRRRAIVALGERGPRTAIKDIARVTTGLLVGRGLKTLGREAIAQIIERDGQPVEGGLSLSQRPTEGALSQTESLRGGLATPDDED